MTTYTQTCSHGIAADHLGAFDNLVHLCRAYFQKLKLKSSIDAERRQLMTMSDAMLRDIGIDRVQATQEATRNHIPEARMEIMGRA